MASRPEAHPPSHARAIIQEAKQGRIPIQQLLGEAAAIADPSFAAEALFALSQDPRLGTAQAATTLDDTLRLAGSVGRGWRKAELLTHLARKAGAWRGREEAAGEARLRFLENLLRMVLEMPPGQALSQALQGVAGCFPAQHLPTLLDRALSNTGFEADDGKAVLRAAVGAGAVNPLVERLQAFPDDALRARLLGALHHQLGKEGGSHAGAVLQHALSSAAKVADPAVRLEVLRTLVACAETVASLHQVIAASAPLDPGSRARVLSAAGGRADKLGDPAQALLWLTEGVAAAASIADAKARSAILSNLQAGLDRLGGKPAAPKAHALPGPTPPPPPPADGNPAADPPAGVLPASPRHVLALYDTYEGGLKEVHLRAIARAAPLCFAFDLDLALMGFPASDIRSLAGQAATETNIGDGGRYLAQLVAAGRVQLVPCTTRDPPTDWSTLGLPVATTSEPEAGKRVDLPQALAAAQAAGRPRVCLIMGLGKRGLPPTLLKAVRHHLELTGKRVSMETATAMGVMAERLRQLPPIQK